MKRYFLEHTCNTRDLGGYPVDFHTHTREGRFIRSDVPVKLSKEELSMFRGLGVTTVVDLRSLGELEKTPSAFAEADGFDYHHIHLNGGSSVIRSEADIPGNYLAILENREAVRQIFTVFAAAPGGVFYHCTAGKDRTGMVSALLLLLAGVADCDMIADYQVTHTYIEKLLTGLIEKRESEDDMPEIPLYLGQSKPEYLSRFLALFREKYGTGEAYLRGVGLSQSALDRIREKLLAESL